MSDQFWWRFPSPPTISKSCTRKDDFHISKVFHLEIFLEIVFIEFWETIFCETIFFVRLSFSLVFTRIYSFLTSTKFQKGRIWEFRVNNRWDYFLKQWTFTSSQDFHIRNFNRIKFSIIFLDLWLNKSEALVFLSLTKGSLIIQL